MSGQFIEGGHTQLNKPLPPPCGNEVASPPVAHIVGLHVPADQARKGGLGGVPRRVDDDGAVISHSSIIAQGYYEVKAHCYVFLAKSAA